MIAFASFVRLAFRQRALHFSGTGRYVLLEFFFFGGGGGEIVEGFFLGGGGERVERFCLCYYKIELIPL